MNFRCCFCGTEQTDDGKIIKEGKVTGGNSEVSELRAENKQLHAKIDKLTEKIESMTPKKKDDDEEDGW